MTRRLRNVLWCAAVMAAFASAAGSAPAAELRWTFQFDHVFVAGTKPLLVYAREIDGQWITGVGSSRDPSLPGAKKTYNRSWYYADMTGVPIKEGKMQGVIKLHMTPDLWVPLDHKGYTIDLKIDATRRGADKIGGTFEILTINSRDASVKSFGRKGTVSATAKPKSQADLPDPVTLTCNMQGSMVGGDPSYGNRCMILLLGLDFIGVDRPNVRMMSLKWIYQTVTRNGRPDFWPIRGAYGHNVWARDSYGKSGAGYFAIGLGGVTDTDKAAMKWYYNRFLLEADTERDAPYDTVSRYPHLSVCAFVNWPLDLGERNPADVLPHCYRDSKAGFYLWRNRWQDDNDTVTTLLTTRTTGYMKAVPDRALKLNSMGKHFDWGTAQGGPTRHWSASPTATSS